jgi:hypothetical protein
MLKMSVGRRYVEKLPPCAIDQLDCIRSGIKGDRQGPSRIRVAKSRYLFASSDK